MGPADLARFAGEGPLNTDDRTVVMYEAPRYIYRPEEPAAVRLMTLLDHCSPSTADILDGDEMAARRLAAYWRARDSFLRGLAEAPRAEARAKLMASLHQSHDFVDAYAFLLQRVIPREFERDPAAVLPLLREMAAAHPQRPQAPRLLRELRSVRSSTTPRSPPAQ
jgi:spermidine synthase